MKPPENWNGCKNCKHLRISSKRGFYCGAFPEQIPIAFASGDVAHLTPSPDQVGTTVWEEKVD